MRSLAAFLLLVQIAYGQTLKREQVAPTNVQLEKFAQETKNFNAEAWSPSLKQSGITVDGKLLPNSLDPALREKLFLKMCELLERKWKRATGRTTILSFRVGQLTSEKSAANGAEYLVLLCDDPYLLEPLAGATGHPRPLIKLGAFSEKPTTRELTLVVNKKYRSMSPKEWSSELESFLSKYANACVLIQSRKLTTSKPTVAEKRDAVVVSMRTNRAEYARVEDTHLLYDILLAVERPLDSDSDLIRFYARSEYWSLGAGLRPEQATFDGNDEKKSQFFTKPGQYTIDRESTIGMFENRNKDLRSDQPAESTELKGKLSSGSSLFDALQSTVGEMRDELDRQLVQRN